MKTGFSIDHQQGMTRIRFSWHSKKSEYNQTVMSDTVHEQCTPEQAAAILQQLARRILAHHQENP